jgi:hypothetical protein
MIRKIINTSFNITFINKINCRENKTSSSLIRHDFGLIYDKFSSSTLSNLHYSFAVQKPKLSCKSISRPNHITAPTAPIDITNAPFNTQISILKKRIHEMFDNNEDSE